jgi:hypothetical protein
MKRIIPWLVGLVVVTLLIGSVYACLQQLGRQADDDVPAGLALSQLDSPDPRVLTGVTPVDLARGPETFVNVYRGDGTPLTGTGTLVGSVPRLPQGVIDLALQTGQDRVTWQPQQGVR